MTQESGNHLFEPIAIKLAGIMNNGNSDVLFSEKVPKCKKKCFQPNFSEECISEAKIISVSYVLCNGMQDCATYHTWLYFNLKLTYLLIWAVLWQLGIQLLTNKTKHNAPDHSPRSPQQIYKLLWLHIYNQPSSGCSNINIRTVRRNNAPYSNA